MDHYILEGHEPVACDMLTWAKWLETAGEARTVAQTHLIDGSMVSTVFLGMDHRFGGGGPPLLFETCLFSGEEEWSELLQRNLRPSEVVARYATWAQAEVGHAEWVERCVPPNLVKANAEHKADQA